MSMGLPVMFQNWRACLQTGNPNPYRSLNYPLTLSCLSTHFEKQSTAMSKCLSEKGPLGFMSVSKSNDHPYKGAVGFSVGCNGRRSANLLRSA